MSGKKFIFFTGTFFSFLFLCCSLFDIQEPVQDFFDYNTGNSSILRAEFSGDYTEGTDGTVSVEPGKDFYVRFYLDNPQNFSFARDSSIGFDVADGGSENVSVVQSDSATILVSYPASFLTEGKNISPRITLYHPVSHADFGTYDGLNLVCNSRPPAISSAEVAVDSGEYVILFSAPSSARLLNDASDITKFYFNEKTVSVSVDSSGAIQGLPSASGFSSSYDFAYWTGVNESAGAQNFSIGWVDRYGVKSAGMNPSAQNFVISFSENIPSGVSVSASGIPSGGTFMQGADFTIPSAVPTLAGYSFAGYATSANGSVTYSAGQTISVTENLNLFAVWTAYSALATPVLKRNGNQIGTNETIQLGADETDATLEIALQDNSSGATFAYSVDGGNSTNGTQVVLAPGTHSVTVTAERSGCNPTSNAYTLTVKEFALQDAVLKRNGNQIGSGSVISLDANESTAEISIAYPDSSVSGVNFVYTIDGGTERDYSVPLSLSAKNSAYTIVVTAKKSGCTESTATYSVTINAATLQQPEILRNSASVGTSETVTLATNETSATFTIRYPDSSVSGVNFVYTVDGGTEQTGSSFTLTAGSHTVKVKSQKNGCNDSAEKTYGISIKLTVSADTNWTNLFNTVDSAEISGADLSGSTSSVSIPGGKTLTISGGTVNLSSLSSQQQFFTVEGTLILENVTIDGSGSDDIQAIYCAGGNVTLKNCTITNMTGKSGGASAIFIENGTVTMESGTITNCSPNSSASVPVISVGNGSDSSTFKMTGGGTIMNCSYYSGAAIISVSANSTFTITGGTISNNTGSGDVISGTGSYNNNGGGTVVGDVASTVGGYHY
jgi:hypothetical protein